MIAQDDDPFKSTPYEIPRFVSLAKDKAYMRTGPGSRFPIGWTYNRKNLPVEITLEYENWRKVKDIDGGEGWVHMSLLSGKRFAVVEADDLIKLYAKTASDSRIMAYVEPGAIVRLLSCGHDWCQVNANGYKGWAVKKHLWGVYSDEVIKN